MKIPGKKNTGEQIRLQDIVIAEDMNEKQVGGIRELLNQKRQQLEQKSKKAIDRRCGSHADCQRGRCGIR